MLAGLAAVVADASAAFEGYDYTRALERTETFFWAFCDDYVELVKSRAYGDPDGAASAETESARAALSLALSALLRLFAPFLPFVTEEVWSWWQEGSVHRAPWPTVAELPAEASGISSDPSLLDAVAEVLGAVRREKTAAKRSMRARVARLSVTAPSEMLAALEAARTDLVDAGGIDALELIEGPELVTAVELAEDEGDKGGKGS
jgi:valyl-tRNA synthetase